MMYNYIIDNGSQGNTITKDVVAELCLKTEPFGAQGNAWGNVVDLSQFVVLTITVYDSNNQSYRYKSRFLVSQNTAPAPFVLGLPFLVNANPNHDYDTGRFLWRKGKHSKAQRMFLASEKKALKGVLHMSNLTIMDNFIGPADLVANMEEYTVKNEFSTVRQVRPGLRHFTALVTQLRGHIPGSGEAIPARERSA